MNLQTSYKRISEILCYFRKKNSKQTLQSSIYEIEVLSVSKVLFLRVVLYLSNIIDLTSGMKIGESSI